MRKHATDCSKGLRQFQQQMFEDRSVRWLNTTARQLSSIHATLAQQLDMLVLFVLPTATVEFVVVLV